MSGRDAGFQLPEFTLTFEEKVREAGVPDSQSMSKHCRKLAANSQCEEEGRLTDLDFE